MLSLILFCISTFALSIASAVEKPMVVVIPSFNNRDWYELNLESVLQQNYRNFRVIYIDDHSTDGTGELVREYLRKNDWEERVHLIHNSERMGALYNIYHAVWSCDPEEIIVTVDGDDWLFHENVLKRLNQIYADPDVWMTYGQYIEFPDGGAGHCQMIPPHVIENNSYRSYAWVSSHLRTFYASLFHLIAYDDFLFQGEFYSAAWDLAFMFPLLEMSSSHFRFIPDVFYVYNQASPINDYKLRRELQLFYEQVIRSMIPYETIETPFGD